MTSLSRALRLVLAACVLAAAPGPQAWAAAGKGAASPSPAPRIPGGRVRVDNPIAGLKVPLAAGAGFMRLPDIDPNWLKAGALPGCELVVPKVSAASAAKAPGAPAAGALQRLEQAQGEMVRAQERGRAEGEKRAQDGLYGEGTRRADEPAVDAPVAEVPFVNFARSSKGSKSASTPIPDDEPQRRGGGDDDVDGIGNPPRDPGQDDGPDGTGGGGGFLGFTGGKAASAAGDGARGLDLAVAGTMIAAAAFTAGAGRTLEAALIVPLVVGSLVFHEMAHAAMAYLFGDAKPVLDDRASFKPRDLGTHIDLWTTVVLPIFSFLMTGTVVGWAKPVETGKDKGRWGEFLTAAAGPAAHLALAGAGALAFAAVGGAAAGFLGTALGLFTMVNAGLFLFNFAIPLYPLDGHHMVSALLPAKWARAYEEFNASAEKLEGESTAHWIARFGFLPYLPLAALVGVLLATGAMAVAVYWLAGIMLGGAGVVGTVQLASSFLPAAAALGLVAGTLKGPAGPPTLNPNNPVAVESLSGQEPVEYIVTFKQPGAVTQDMHLDWVDSKGMFYARRYAKTQQALLAQAAKAGLTAEELADAYKATAKGSYRRINAITFRVPAETAEAFRLRLEADGHKVDLNRRRFRIPDPDELRPDQDDPAAARGVSIPANLKAVRADELMKIAEERWGKPGAGLWGLVRRVLLGAAPQPRIGVIDTGMRRDHKMLLGVNEPKNATSGPNEDDNGHGTWVSGMIRAGNPHLNNLTHYKAFVGGSASDDDILKALTMSANDGNIVISNSWGSDEGDPKNPTSLMALKMAEEGHIVVFAAGNNGYSGMDTIGDPAIVYMRTADGTPRVVSVAAASVDGRINAFSSKGLKSPKTKDDPSYPADHPHLSAVGVNVQGAWLKAGADVVDAVYGELKAISGTSMSTPEVVMAIAQLAMLFGVIKTGRELDTIVKAILETAVKKDGRGHAYEGAGFLDAKAAYDKAVAWGLKPVAPNFLRRGILSLMRRGASSSTP